jgi:hypothetical protein
MGKMQFSCMYTIGLGLLQIFKYSNIHELQKYSSTVSVFEYSVNFMLTKKGQVFYKISRLFFHFYYISVLYSSDTLVNFICRVHRL